jgi:outer membrane receptor protein involved in Fe transport
MLRLSSRLRPERHTIILVASTLAAIAALWTPEARAQVPDADPPLPAPPSAADAGVPADGGAPDGAGAGAGDAGAGDVLAPLSDGGAPETGASETGASETGAAPPVPLGQATEEPGTDPQTGIRGRIAGKGVSTPLAHAPVIVVGQDGRVRTFTADERGHYVARVPPGTYTVRSRYDLYHGARISGVRVTRGKLTQTNLVLDPIDLEEEVIVQEIEIPYRADTTTAAAQDQLRKESSAIGEGMGAKQMSQQGASDAASAARRVVGVTVDKNQLIVRGLGGRYVKVLLNGLPIPNTDPDYPSVDLDLFPTNVIDSLNVQKAFLPDIPGDFAGGTLDITTVSFPRKFTLEAGVGLGLNSQTSFRSRLDYRGGSYDALGFDDGTRALPDAVEGKKLRPRRGHFPDPKAVEAAAETFTNTWQYRRTDALPKMGVDLTVGDAIKFGRQNRVGYLAALVYDYSIERLTGVTRPKPGAGRNDAVEASRYATEVGSEQVQLAAIGTASLDVGLDHSFTVLTLFNRAMEDETKYRDGINAEVSQTARYQKWQLQFLARTLFLNQLLADHRNLFGTRLRLRWSAYYALGRRDEPDLRTVTYGEHEGVADRWKPTADRLFSDLSQTDLGANLSLRFPLWPQAWGTLGGRVGTSDRDFTTRRFQMRQIQGGADASVYKAGPEVIFGPEGNGTLSYMEEFTSPRDSYVANQTQFTGFFMLETPIVGPLSLAGGVRLEAFRQEISSRSPFPEDNTPESLAANRRDRRDFNSLPGAALKYEITETMLARLAYGMTVSRPQVRELAPYDYYDFLRDRTITGDPDLKTARIHNVDLRWEWFFREGQILALSGFYKRFIDPIELQIIAVDQNSTYVNAKGATSMGGEFEVRSDLAVLGNALRHFSVGGNLSLIHSKIEIAEKDAGATRGERRLAGQAPYVINLSLRYAHPGTSVSAGLVYNVVGPRITDVGIRVGALDILPDVEEQAFHSLDFLANWGLGEHLKLKFRVRNLLDQHRVLKQGSLVTQDLKPGISGSIGLGYEY